MYYDNQCDRTYCRLYSRSITISIYFHMKQPGPSNSVTRNRSSKESISCLCPSTIMITRKVTTENLYNASQIHWHRTYGTFLVRHYHHNSASTLDSTTQNNFLLNPTNILLQNLQKHHPDNFYHHDNPKISPENLRV